MYMYRQTRAGIYVYATYPQSPECPPSSEINEANVCVCACGCVCACARVRVRVCSKKHTRVSLQPSLLLCSPAPPLPYPISPNSFIHYFACAFYRVKKETNSPEDVDSFYTSRASDPNVRDEMIRN